MQKRHYILLTVRLIFVFLMSAKSSLAQTAKIFQGGELYVKLYNSGKTKIHMLDTVSILQYDSIKVGRTYLTKFNFTDNYMYVFDIPKDLANGHYMFFFDSLQKRPALQFNINNKKYEGLFEYYRPSGLIEYTSFYLNGIKNGLDISYSPTGKLSSLTQYINGKKIGFSFSAFNNSTTSQILYYKNDTTMTVLEKWGLHGDTPELLQKNTIKINVHPTNKSANK